MRSRNKSSEYNFMEWCEDNDFSANLIEILKSNGYSSVAMAKYITEDNIARFNILHLNDVKRLRIAVGLEQNEENEQIGLERNLEEDMEIIEKKRWKEFGMAREFPKWKKNHLPCEIFSPDGFWAWNCSAHFLSFKQEKIKQIWGQFQSDEANWMLSPPVLLPISLKGFKVTFNIRKKPDEENDNLKLEIVLLNDSYNKFIDKKVGVNLNFDLIYKFIALYDGSKVGSEHVSIKFTKLFDSCEIDLPGRLLTVDKPPIIEVQIIRN